MAGLTREQRAAKAAAAEDTSKVLKSEARTITLDVPSRWGTEEAEAFKANIEHFLSHATAGSYCNFGITIKAE